MMRTTESIAITTSVANCLRGSFSSSASVIGAPVVVFTHGLGSTHSGEKAVAFEAECARREWAFAGFDFHGHGASDGTMLDLRGARLLTDLDAITQFVNERGHTTIFLVGSSMGGWAASWLAALHPQRVRACALLAPAFRFLEWRRLSEAARQLWRTKGRYRLVNEWVDLELDYDLHAEAEQYPFDQLCERFVTPSLLIHGMKDDTVPYSGSSEFIERCAAADVQLLLIKNGDHRLSAHKEFLARTVCDFFAARV